MVSYMNEVINRLVAIEIEAMATMGVTRVDAKPYFHYTGESFPYFTHRIADTPVSDNGSEVEDLNSPTVVIRLVIGHVTEGYRGEIEVKLYEWLPVLKSYIQARSNWLQSVAYPAPMEDLQQSRVINGGGLRIFQNEGINSTQIGAEIPVACTFLESIDYAYYGGNYP
jgi:hypothetical protein